MKKSEWKKAAIKARAKVRLLRAKVRRLRRMERVAYEGLRKASEEGRAEIQALTKERDEARKEADRIKALPPAPAPASAPVFDGIQAGGLAFVVEDGEEREDRLHDVDFLDLEWWRPRGWRLGWETSPRGDEMLGILCATAEGPWDGKDRRAIMAILCTLVATGKKYVAGDEAKDALSLLEDFGRGWSFSIAYLRQAEQAVNQSIIRNNDVPLSSRGEGFADRRAFSSVVLRVLKFASMVTPSWPLLFEINALTVAVLHLDRPTECFLLAQRTRDRVPVLPPRACEINRSVPPGEPPLGPEDDVRWFENFAHPEDVWSLCQRGDTMLVRLAASTAGEAWDSRTRCEVIRHLCGTAIYWLDKEIDQRLKFPGHLGRGYSVGRKELYAAHRKEKEQAETAIRIALLNGRSDQSNDRLIALKAMPVNRAIDAIFVAARTTAHPSWPERVRSAVEAVYLAVTTRCPKDHFRTLLSNRIRERHPHLPALPPATGLAQGAWPGPLPEDDQVVGEEDDQDDQAADDVAAVAS